VRTDPVLTAPIEIPNVLPEIDLSRPLTDPSAFIRPTPPVSPRGSGEAGETSDTAIYVISQVERPATHAPNSAAPPYPDILRQAGVEGEVLVSFVVDTSGRVDPTTVKVIRTTHELFAAAVKNALPRMRFIPAEVGERKVRQLVQQPYSFAIVK
jgi:periplasmic protein TonB